MEWSKVSSGGGASAGDGFDVTATVGQVDTGRMAGGSFAVEAGFWSFSTTAPTLISPSLGILLAGESILISWPANSTGFVLERAGSLANPAGWQDAHATPVTANGITTVTLPIPDGTAFFRLRHP